jgi:hypothetical protein
MAFDIEYIVRLVDEFTAPARQISASLATISEHAEKVQKHFHHLERQFKVASRVMTESFTLPLSAIGGLAIKAFSDMEKVTLSLKTAGASSQELTQIIAGLHSIAEKGVASMDDLAESTRSLMDAGVSGSSVSGLMNQLASVAAGSGQKIGDVAGFYAKIKEAGHLSGGDMGELAKFGLLDELQKHMRTASGGAVNLKELRKALAAGTISFGTFNKLVEVATEGAGKFAHAQDAVSHTISGSLAGLKESISGALEKLGTGLDKTFNIADRIQQLSRYVDHLGDSFQDFSKAHPVLTKLLYQLGAILAAIGPLLFVMAMISGIFMVGAGAIRLFIAPFMMLIKVLEFAKTAIMGVSIAMDILSANPIVLIIAAIIAVIAGLVYVIYRFRHQIADFFSAIGSGIFSFVMSGINKIRDFIKEIIGLFQKVEAVASKVFSRGKGAAGGVHPVVAGATQPINSTLEHKSSSMVTVNIKDNGNNVKSVETKSKGVTNFNVGTNMASAM